MKRVGYLENLPKYIRNSATNNYNELMNKLNQKNIYKLQGKLPYSASMIWYGLHLRYRSLQAYMLFSIDYSVCILTL